MPFIRALATDVKGTIRYTARVENYKGDPAGVDAVFVETDRSDGCLLVLVVDVMGHGLPAAPYVERLQPFLSEPSVQDRLPDELLSVLHSLWAPVWAESFHHLCGAAVLMDPARARLTASNAALPEPVIGVVGAAVRIWKLPSGGILGVPELETAWTSHQSMLQPGESLVLFTDGVSETHSPGTSGFFCVSGVQSLMTALPGGTPGREILERLYQSLRAIAADEWAQDDTTAVVVERADGAPDGPRRSVAMQLLTPTPSGGIDHRTTFVRRHVPDELARTEEDILALEELRQRLEDLGAAADDPRLREQVNAVEFFHRDLPEQRLYVPVRIVEARRRQRRYAGLTSLLRRTRRDPHGVLLQAGSGTGKTVACRRAFFDCLPHRRHAGRTVRPRLPRHVPCWVRTGDDLPEGLHGRSLVELLVLRSAGFNESRFPVRSAADLEDAPVRQWLNSGPPLLLFFDLNTADAHNRLPVAQALVSFQRQYLERGHRCVVTYRSTHEGDPVLEVLRESADTPFRPYDLLPLHVSQARGYLRSLRSFEAELRSGLHLEELPPHSIDEDCARLEELDRRHVRGAESLISTPLLMHFVSTLDSAALASVRTLWDLYRHVVRRHLRRDARYVRAMPAPLAGRTVRHQRLLTAMVRIALATLAGGAASVRLRGRDVQRFLKRPREGTAPQADGSPSWWPHSAYWHEAPYFKQRFAEDEIGHILEFSLLRSHPDGVGFLHDSFLYFFAAYALRHYEEPEGPSLQTDLRHYDDAWFREVVERIRENPEIWKLPAEFLGGALVAQDQGEDDGS